MVEGDAEQVARSAERSTDPEELVQRLGHRGLTIATAESLTAGALASRIADVPGASVAMLGGVVAYSNGVKENVLSVDADLLETHGAVDGEVAAQMARGGAQACAAEIGVSTTGVAGPEPHQGKSVGTVYLGFYVAPGVVERLGLSCPAQSSAAESVTEQGALAGYRLLDLDGDREAIRWASVEGALQLVNDLLHTEPAGLPEA
ncbi:CinA family protein [Nesterenkonia sphaerica]|uniref:Nicotinamide-nucleotide amidohydrolase family protein n=1 Tax=Nesterenkonia sphaerica TaxID=1804988 RepID=A0A5R9A9S7_9MICC|nr:nicotinamide-nucleotide amidohydrolase family protein [Nesterenkonia sphaerica]TLP75529.1 nicotinamide-nucleotide amidohydrolase family protein [Nesterenkonia sphaerica]